MLNSRHGCDTQGLILNRTLRYHETILVNGDEFMFSAILVKNGKLLIGAGEMPLIICENAEAGG